MYLNKNENKQRSTAQVQLTVAMPSSRAVTSTVKLLLGVIAYNLQNSYAIGRSWK